ncbi:fibroblast growth factor receptor-like isoform X2 [Oscarella lobularis]|uniref:fibroblast growth factor receptor-like isoform X2 n=1 Tax=Oscarella lobularis TaxID=121494 RepID=UPI0033137A2C
MTTVWTKLLASYFILLQITLLLTVPRVQGCPHHINYSSVKADCSNQWESWTINRTTGDDARNCSCNNEGTSTIDLAICCNTKTGAAVSWKSGNEDVPCCDISNLTTQPFCAYPIDRSLEESVLLIKSLSELSSRKFSCFEDDKRNVFTIELPTSIASASTINSGTTNETTTTVSTVVNVSTTDATTIGGTVIETVFVTDRPKATSNTTTTTTIALSLVLLLTIGILLAYFFYKRNRRCLNAKFRSTALLSDQGWEETSRIPTVQARRLQLQCVIGQGHFAKIFEAIKVGDRKESSQSTVAVKYLLEDDQTRRLEKEANILFRLGRHDNIISFLGKTTSDIGQVGLVFEFAPLGNLKLHLKRYEVKSGLMIDFARQIATGMKYVASQRCVHRDLAARNVLVFKNDRLKIADFGRAIMTDQQEQVPVKWTAPEALCAPVFSELSDVWSFGIVCWEIATLGGTPYPGVPIDRLGRLLSDAKSNYRMSRPKNCPEILKDLMKSCWEFEPSNRPTFAAILETIQDSVKERSQNAETIVQTIDQA